MTRTSRVHYIAPSAISITPNANGTASDLAVYIARNARIRVFSQKVGDLQMRDETWQTWAFSGRNRRLADASKPYTIYARLRKVTDYSDPGKVAEAQADGYLLFVAKRNVGGETGWADKYNYVTTDGITDIEGATTDRNYWYIRLGDVSLPSGNARTVDLDTGILGTDQYNMDWATNPDDLPLRVEIGCTIDDEDAGPTPYLRLDKQLVLTAMLMEGWAEKVTDRFDHWTIQRNTGDETADEAWDAAHAAAFRQTGSLVLSHLRDGTDDFAGSAAAVFTVTAWGHSDEPEPGPEPEPEPEEQEVDASEEEPGETGSGDTESEEQPQSPDSLTVPLAEASITILAETMERYDIIPSAGFYGYNDETHEYIPAEGITMRVRATDRNGAASDLSYEQFSTLCLSLEYSRRGSDTWMTIPVGGVTDAVVTAVLPREAMALRADLEIRLIRVVSMDLYGGGSTEKVTVELTRTEIAYTTDTEDTKDREWIFLRSRTSLVFGTADSDHPEPYLIDGGQVNPPAEATGLDHDKNQDGWVPEGWLDDDPGADGTYFYVYASYRDYVYDEGGGTGHWGDFVFARIWHHYREGSVTYDLVPSVTVVNAAADGTIDSPGIIVRAYRQDRPEENILPDYEYPENEEYYYAEYRLDEEMQGEQERWRLCGPFFYPTGPEDDIEMVPAYGIDAEHVALAAKAITLRLKHSSDPDSVLKEIAPVNVVRSASEQEIIDIIDEHAGGEYLSKVHDDVAAGRITFRQGIISVLQACFGAFGRIPAHGGTAAEDTGAAILPDGTGDFINLIVRALVKGDLTIEELLSSKDIVFRRWLKSQGARKGFTDGNGIYMDAGEGLIETDGLNVRGFMRVMELIINRLQLMESDYSFTEGDTVDHVDYEDLGQTLVLSMHKDHDTDFTPFYPGDIIYGIVNLLLERSQVVGHEQQWKDRGYSVKGDTVYYRFWLRAKSVDHTENKIRAVPFQGKYQSGTDPETGEPVYTAVVPGGTNFSPYGTAIGTDVSAPMLEEYNTHTDPDDPASPTLGEVGFDTMLTITRAGNVADGINPDTGQVDEHIRQSQLGRQQSWVLSTTDKRLSFFWRVDAPIIRDENYALCLGILPDLANLPTTRDPDMPSLYINTLFADNIEQANYPARVVKVDRGAWTATPQGTYEGEDGGTWTPDGTTTVPGDVDEHGQLRVYDQHTHYGQTGVPQTVQPGAVIDEPYHMRTFTKADWLYKRLSQAWASLTDAELERMMLRQSPKADLEVSRVWNGGKLWECLTDGTAQEPALGCTAWLQISGGGSWDMVFADGNGAPYTNVIPAAPGYVDLTIVPSVIWGDEDVTSQVDAWEWHKYLADGTEDTAWGALHNSRSVRLTDRDMPTAWGRQNPVRFKCVATISEMDIEIEKTVGFGG